MKILRFYVISKWKVNVAYFSFVMESRFPWNKVSHFGPLVTFLRVILLVSASTLWRIMRYFEGLKDYTWCFKPSTDHVCNPWKGWRSRFDHSTLPRIMNAILQTFQGSDWKDLKIAFIILGSFERSNILLQSFQGLKKYPSMAWRIVCSPSTLRRIV